MRLFRDKQVIIVAALSMLGLCLSMAAGMAAPLHEYQTQVLFSFEYGPEPEQIGIRPGPGEVDMGEERPALSVGGITVAADDLIYISDQVQHRIKRFTSRGELTLIVDKTVKRFPDSPGQRDVEVRVRAAGPVVADPQGRFYAGQVFDADGVIQLSVRGESGTILEPRGADLLRSQIAAAARGLLMYKGAEPSSVFTRRYCDIYGNTYVGIPHAPNDFNVAVIRFDSNLRFSQVVPGSMVGWDGRSYGGVPGSESEPNDLLRIWAYDGTPEKIVVLRPPRGTATDHYDWSRNRWLYTGQDILFDAAGDIFKVRSTRLPRDQWIELRPDFTIRYAITIFKFDHDGNFLLRLDLRGLPFRPHAPVAVDPAGNIYHLEYYEDHVDFVKEVLVVGASGGES